MALVMPKQPTHGSNYDVPFELHPIDEGNFNDQVDQNHKKFVLPAGFPKYLNSSLAWSGPELGRHEYIYHLTEGDKLEIDKALFSFKGAKSFLSLSCLVSGPFLKCKSNLTL